MIEAAVIAKDEQAMAAERRRSYVVEHNATRTWYENEVDTDDLTYEQLMRYRAVYAEEAIEKKKVDDAVWRAFMG